jgi:diacylglycerol O-acyltransferase / wax synthase
MSRERMSSVDTAWLRMDSPHNLMMIVGFQVFDSPVAYADLCAMLEKRLLKFKRFKQKVERDATGAWWVRDRAFDIEHHVQRITFEDSAGEKEAQALVAELATQPLDPERPLWQFHLVENYRGGQALVSRIHHCIGDGIALVAVMMSLTDQPGRSDEPESTESEAGELESNPWKPYVQPITKGTIKAIHATGAAWSKSLEIIAQPDKLVDYAQMGSQVIKDALRIALMPNDSPTRLKGKPGTSKAVAWNDPLPLDEVKIVCKALGASINDVAQLSRTTRR